MTPTTPTPLPSGQPSKEASAITFTDAVRISQEVARDPSSLAEQKLCAKCQWEHMTRAAVIMEWGDPRGWITHIPNKESKQ